MRIVAAMSGGVDSAVAAALLQDEGHEVIGVTLQLADLSAQGLGVSRCCSPADIAGAREAAERLGFAHYVLDLEASFRREVLDPFVRSFVEGRTPSPCVRCNSRIKLGELLGIARQLGGEALATGHYARRELDERGNPVLLRGSDRGRDQSYFLFELTEQQLAFVRFPLGGREKAQVRQIAHGLGLPSAERRDSQEICFVPPGSSYVEVLERLAPGSLPAGGEIVDGQGNVVGTHGGVHRFTVGQRRGIGVAAGRRLYVTELDAAGRRVVVGGVEEGLRRELRLVGMNWLVGGPPRPLRADVQVRSRHQAAPAAVVPDENGGAMIAFDEPVLAPAPGQAAVVYRGARVLGGGWIVSTA